MSSRIWHWHRLLKSAVIQTKSYFWIIDQEILDSARILRQEMIFDFDSRAHTLNLSFSVNFHSLTPRFCRELDQHPNYPYITSNVAQGKSSALLRPSTKMKGYKLGISVRHLCAKKNNVRMPDWSLSVHLHGGEPNTQYVRSRPYHAMQVS